MDRGDLASVERLLDGGANIEGVQGNKETPLIMAKDAHGNTTLAIASKGQHADVVRILETATRQR